MRRRIRHAAIGAGIASKGLPVAAALGLLLAWSGAAWAQLPQIRVNSYFPTGGQVGTTVDLKITAGADMDQVEQLHFSNPGIKAEPVMAEPTPFQAKPQPVPNQFKVTIAKDVEPGIYELRAIGRFGMSNARAFVVDTRPQVLEVEPNNSLDKAQAVELNSVVQGTADKQGYDYYKFTAKKGQRIIISAWGNRIDSQMDTSLVFYDAAGVELARDRDTNRRDAMIDYSIPADGDYIVRIYDFLYDGGDTYFYRLVIGTGPYIDFIYPPVGEPGKKASFTVFGRNLPGGSAAGINTADGKPLEKLDVQIDVPAEPQARLLDIDALVEPQEIGIDAFQYRVTSPAGVSNAARIGIASAPVVLEQEPNSQPDKVNKVTPPCEFIGQFNPRGDEDWVQFDAKKGQVFQITVISNRLGLPTDPFLIVQQVTKDDKGKEQVKELQAVDDPGGGGRRRGNQGGSRFDVNGDDPEYTLTAPDDGTYRVVVRDLYADTRGEPRFVYRLAIRPREPDFRLVAMPVSSNQQNNQVAIEPWSALLRKGGTEPIDIMVIRNDGFDGPIEVTAESLPKGVTCAPAVIAGWDSTATLVLRAADDAADWSGTIKITGKAKIDGKDIVRQARAGEVVWPAVNNKSSSRSRMTRDLALAVLGSESAPYTIELGDGKPLAMSRAGKLEIPIKVQRREGFKDKLAIKAVGLHKEIKANNVNIDGDKTEGKIELTFSPNAPVGTFSCYVTADAQFEYSRNADGAKAAADEKKRLEDMAKQFDETSKKATEEQKKADQAATEAAAALKKATDAAKAADDALAKAQAKKDDKDALAKAQQAKADAEKAVTEAQQKSKAAEEAKAAANEAFKKASADAKAIADAVKKAADEAKKLADAAKPKKLKVSLPSTLATVTVTAGPIAIKPVAAATVKQGDKVEVDVPIDRLYGFDDEVAIELVAPGGVSGVAADGKPKIDKGQASGKLTITAAKNATPGKHQFTVRIRPKYNGQTLDLTEPFDLTVQEVK